MDINKIIYGMTPQEKDVYFSHMEKRHREEEERLNAEKERLSAYKESLIEDILKYKKKHTKEELMEKSIRTLEIIAFN